MPSHKRPFMDAPWSVSFGIEDSVAHATDLRRGIYIDKLQPAWRPICPFLAVGE